MKCHISLPSLNLDQIHTYAESKLEKKIHINWKRMHYFQLACHTLTLKYKIHDQRWNKGGTSGAFAPGTKITGAKFCKTIRGGWGWTLTSPMAVWIFLDPPRCGPCQGCFAGGVSRLPTKAALWPVYTPHVQFLLFKPAWHKTSGVRGAFFLALGATHFILLP